MLKEAETLLIQIQWILELRKQLLNNTNLIILVLINMEAKTILIQLQVDINKSVSKMANLHRLYWRNWKDFLQVKRIVQIIITHPIIMSFQQIHIIIIKEAIILLFTIIIIFLLQHNNKAIIFTQHSTNMPKEMSLKITWKWNTQWQRIFMTNLKQHHMNFHQFKKMYQVAMYLKTINMNIAKIYKTTNKMENIK